MLLTILLSVGLIALDQVSKILATRFLATGGPVTVIPGILEFRYVQNDGAAFSLFSGQQTLLIVVTGIAMLVGAYILLFRRPKDKLEYISILLIFSGGVGNLIDRIANGYVVDFFNVLFIDFAIFNIADIFVTVGFVLLVVAVIRSERRARKEKQLASQAGQEAASVTANPSGSETNPATGPDKPQTSGNSIGTDDGNH